MSGLFPFSEREDVPLGHVLANMRAVVGAMVTGIVSRRRLGAEVENK